MVQNVRVQGDCSGGGATSTATFVFSLLAAVLAALAFSQSAAAVVDDGIASPSISSDKADYAPGELVMLRGSDWRAGELVTIDVNDDGGRTWRRTVDVTADGAGAVLDSFNLPDWFVAIYTVRATGESGSTATTTFTDASLSVRAAPTGVSFSLTYQGFSNASCTTPVSGSNGDAQTVTVTAGTPAGISFGSASFEKLTAGSAGAPSGATFAGWTGPSAFSAATAGICIATPSGGNDHVYTATYSAPAKANQAITFDQPASPAPYNSTFLVSATASSGLAVGISASGVCTISGSTVTMTSGAGACTLTASQSGNASFNPAANVTRTVVASKLGQTISFGGLANRTFGDADFAVSATGGASGNTVTFSFLGQCEASDTGEVHLTGAGSCTITAAQAGNENFTAAPSVPQAFAIAKATATLSLSNLGHTYDGSTKAAAVTTTPAGISGVSITYAGSATEPTNAGSYAVVASLTNANYMAADATGALIIDPKPASVSPAAVSKTYGGEDPVLSGELEGFLTADGVTASYSRAPGESVAGGPYAISATLAPAAVLGNYEIGYDTAEFTIERKPASVSPAASSKTYGDEDPVLSGALEGFLAADGVTASYSRVPGESVTGGPYAISTTLAPVEVLGNYDITYETAAFTIGRKPASVSPAAASKTYGDEDPVLSGALEGFLAADGVSASYSRAAGESVAGGPYAINATLAPAAVLGNYEIVYGTADFAIGRKPASVSPAAASKTYGDDDPGLGGELSGFLAADGVTAAYSRELGEAVAGAPYAISAVLSPAPVLVNYEISYGTAQFTIEKRAASVSPAPASKTYGDDDPALTGELDGFLPSDDVTASYSRVPGESVTGGPYAISASLAPVEVLGNYEVSYETAAFTIGRKPASVSPAAASKTYGDEDPVLSGELEGFLAADGVTAGYSREPGESVAGGPYAISAALSPAAVLGNYEIGYDTAEFTINPRPITVRANDATKVYGDEEPLFAIALSAGTLAAGDTLAGLGTPVFAFEPAAPTAAGSYRIEVSGLDNSNYEIGYPSGDNRGQLTITKRPITVKAVALTKILGAPDPQLTYAVTSGSLVAGDGFTGSLARDPGEAIGSYEIRQGDLTAGENYMLSFVGAKLSILFAWSGFLQPINDTAHQTGVIQSKFRLGQTIPARFVLRNAAGTAVQQTTSPTFSRSGNLGQCEIGATLETIIEILTPDAGVVYSWDGSKYHYNWSTKGLTAGEYRMYANLADGTKRYVDICLTK